MQRDKHTTMKYTEDFIQLVKSKRFNYLGVGNPNAKILIIGKEAAIDKSSDQYQTEICDNCHQWETNITNHIYYDNLLDNSLNNKNINPLYPYKGQKCEVRCEIKQTDENENENVKLRGEYGTSRTWTAYQKLYDLIADKPKKGKEDDIDFHKYVFTSDLSTETAPMSNMTDLDDTQKSIQERNDLFSYLSHFPIIIVAAGHYPKMYGFDMETVFNVKWESPTLDVGNKFINIHFDEKKKRILIHTNQLSFYSNELLEQIASQIRNFIIKDLHQDNIIKYLEE